MAVKLFIVLLVNAGIIHAASLPSIGANIQISEPREAVDNETVEATSQEAGVTDTFEETTEDGMTTKEVVQTTSAPEGVVLYDCTDGDHFGPGFYVDVWRGCRYYHHCLPGQVLAFGMKCWGSLLVNSFPNVGGPGATCWPLCDYQKNVDCASHAGKRLYVQDNVCHIGEQ